MVEYRGILVQTIVRILLLQERERDGPLSHAVTRMSSNFHLALSKSDLRLDVASLEISMPETSFTLSWISPRIIMR